MPEEYISIDMTVEETTLSDEAVERLQDKWPTWEPNDADLEVVQIENFASMAAAVADTAASVPSTILQTLGMDLYGVEPGLGEAALGLLTITFMDSAGGYVVPAGSGFDIDGFAFTTVNDVISTAGQGTATNVQIQATEEGTAYNGLAGNDVSPISALSDVLSADLQAPTTGGADADTDEQYMARLLQELQLMSRTLTVLRDYEEFALSHTDVARALALNNGSRAVAVFLLGPDGLPVSGARKAALLVEYDDAREVNTSTTLWDPAFGVINVTYSVSAYPGYGVADLIQRCNAKLADELDPLMWGRPKFIGDVETNLWINDPVVRRNKLIDALGDVEGVNYVYSLVLSGTNQSGGAALTVSGRPQQDLLTRTATGGQYKLSLDGQVTSDYLNWDSTGTNIRTALESLSNAEPGDFVVSGDAFPVTITYTGAYHGRTRSLSLSGSTLTGGTITITTPQSAVAGSGDVTLPLANNMVGVPVPGDFSGGVVL